MNWVGGEEPQKRKHTAIELLMGVFSLDAKLLKFKQENPHLFAVDGFGPPSLRESLKEEFRRQGWVW